MTFRLDLAVRSDTGRMREHNEDLAALLLQDGRTRALGCSGGPDDRITGRWPADPCLALLLLDGMGGQSSGELPCRIILADLREHLLPAALAVPAPERGSWLAQLLAATSQRLATQTIPGAGQGASAALALVVGASLHLVHAGDVRVYLLRDGQLAPLTRDDSLYNLAREHGLADEQLRELPPGIITQGLGFPDLQPHHQQLALVAGDRLLLCTRGLHHAVDDPAIARALQASPADACAALVALALAADTRSNVTVLVAQVEDTPPP